MFINKAKSNISPMSSLYGYIPDVNERAELKEKELALWRDDFADDRRVLREFRLGLRERFGRRKLLRVGDVERYYRERFGAGVGRRLEFKRDRPVPEVPDVEIVERVWPEVDLTCEEIL